MRSLLKTVKEKRNCLVSDFICGVCRVEATRNDDRICEVCRAIGKSAEPDLRKSSWRALLFKTMRVKKITAWLKSRNSIKFTFKRNDLA